MRGFTPAEYMELDKVQCGNLEAHLMGLLSKASKPAIYELIGEVDDESGTFLYEKTLYARGRKIASEVVWA